MFKDDVSKVLNDVFSLNPLRKKKKKNRSVYLSLIKLPYVSRQINMTCDDHSISFLA